VLPFRTAAPLWRPLGDGVVHLLSARLGGNGELRRISPHTVLSRARSQSQGSLDGAAAASLARDLGASSFVSGSLVLAGDELQISAAWHEVDGTDPPVEHRVQGGSQDLAELIDQLGERLTTGRVSADDVHIARVAAVTSQSPAALQSYLDAEAALTAADYAEAMRHFEAAIQHDPQFALAYFRLSEIARWRSLEETAAAARQQALLLSNRLPMQERLLLDIELDELRGDLESARRRYRELLAVAPDEWEAWLRLAQITPDPSAAGEALGRVQALLPHHTGLTPGPGLAP
jgi:tetratricopeptide (TPR) repeat protein